MQIQYVVGFMIRPETEQVLFIQKNRPEFQKGKWNGIGGKIEAGERPIQAMVREFQEETGVETAVHAWEHTLTHEGRNARVYVFRSFVNRFPAFRTVTYEVVAIWSVDDVYNTVLGHDGERLRYVCPTLVNIRWILPLQLSQRVKFPLHVEFA